MNGRRVSGELWRGDRCSVLRAFNDVVYVYILGLSGWSSVARVARSQKRLGGKV